MPAAYREIWDGEGEVGDRAYWTKDNGELVGLPYVRRRASSYLSRWSGHRSLGARRAALRATLGNDAWLAARAFQTVSSLLREVETALILHLGE